MQVLDIDDFNDFFTKCSELLHCRIPHRFNMGELFNPNKLTKNFEAVIRGIERRIKKENEEMAKTIQDMQQGVIRGLQDVGEYTDQMVELNVRLGTIIKNQEEEIAELKAKIEAKEKEGTIEIVE